jgi:hypothetical protein
MNINKQTLITLVLVLVTAFTSIYFTKLSYKEFVRVEKTDSGNFIIVQEKIYSISELKTEGFERVDIFATRNAKVFNIK